MCQTWVKLISVYGRKEGFSREEFFIHQAGPHMRKAGQVPEFCGRIKDSYQSGIIQPEEWPVLASISNLPRTDQKDSIVILVTTHRKIVSVKRDIYNSVY